MIRVTTGMPDRKREHRVPPSPASAIFKEDERGTVGKRGGREGSALVLVLDPQPVLASVNEKVIDDVYTIKHNDTGLN
jgi:hypothetical protein